MASRPRPDPALRPALDVLAARDPDIARLYPDCGLPLTRPRVPGFAGLLRIIVSQQVSIHAAQAILARLRAAAHPLTPERFLALSEDRLREIGLSRQKMRYARALAEDLQAGRISLRAVARLDDEAAIEALSRVKGIGRWSAEIYLLFSLRRPDVWPADDLALQAAARRLKGLSERPDRPVMEALAEPWRPHRSAAARLLWHLYRHPALPE